MDNRSWGYKKNRYYKKKNYYYNNKKYNNEEEEPKTKSQIAYEKMYNRIVSKINANKLNTLNNCQNKKSNCYCVFINKIKYLC